MRLINADELKQKVKVIRSVGGGELRYITEMDIDNATTVEVFTSDQVKELVDLNRKLSEERSQGEWVAREDMDYLDKNNAVHNHFECNKCGLIHDFVDGHTSQYNFCPQCGASMQKGGTE